MFIWEGRAAPNPRGFSSLLFLPPPSACQPVAPPIEMGPGLLNKPQGNGGGSSRLDFLELTYHLTPAPWGGWEAFLYQCRCCQPWEPHPSTVGGHAAPWEPGWGVWTQMKGRPLYWREGLSSNPSWHLLTCLIDKETDTWHPEMNPASQVRGPGFESSHRC